MTPTRTTTNWWPVVAIAALLLAGAVTYLRSSIGSYSEQTGTIEHVNAKNFEERVLRSGTPVLVDFYADWCRPCRTLAPVLEEFAQENPHVKIVKVNVDRNPELAARYGINSIPNLLVFQDNRVTGQHTGLADKASLKRLLTP